MRDKSPKSVSDEERALFRDAVADARPLNIPPPPARLEPPPPVPVQTRRDEQQVLVESLDPMSLGPDDIETGDELVHRRADVPTSILRKLRRGQYAIQAELDLHGMTTVQAADSLGQFIHQCLAHGLRTVRIIHGKGHGSPQKRPVLKGKVGLWLQRRDDVLAFCSARAQDGGTGAIYVLLRANKARGA